MTDLTADLEQLGTALQQATRREHRSHRGRSSRRLAVFAAAAATLLLAVGVSVAATLWPTPTPTSESVGLVASDAAFAGEHPQCAAVTSAQLHCVLSSAPTGLVVAGSYIGAKVATVDATHHVNGGCIATSFDGRAWDCYVGHAAIDHGIIDNSYLGAYRPDIAHG
jgi:hypothetical protein